MTKIIFICHGNICRSPATELMMKKLAADAGIPLAVSSAATTTEEIGNGIYPPMRSALNRKGIPLSEHHARKTSRQDYAEYDLIVGMDQENMTDLLRIYGGDPQHKISMLLQWAGDEGEVYDPWYTRDFDRALRDIERGCKALLKSLSSHS